MTLISFGLMGVIVILLCLLVLLERENKIERQKAEERFRVERQQLLDRIQAPSFDHYKQAEVRVIKAQKDEPPKPTFPLE